MELFLSTAGVKITHVPYRSVPQAQQAVMTGEVAAFFDTPITALPQVKAGTVRALGISTAKRLAVAPELPTIAEAGLAGYEVVGWNGVLAPAGTPRPIIDKLNKALRDALASDVVKKQLTLDGTEITPGTPEDYVAFIDKDEKKWAGLVKASGVEQE